MTSPASAAAILEIRVIATAIVAIGHGSTVDEIATAAGLPRNTVMRRLRSSALVTPGLAPQYFVYNRMACTWGLTSAGLAVANEHKPGG